MKIPMMVMIASVWTVYAACHDKKPVPKWNHAAINALYAALLVVTGVFVP